MPRCRGRRAQGSASAGAVACCILRTSQGRDKGFTLHGHVDRNCGSGLITACWVLPVLASAGKHIFWDCQDLCSLELEMRFELGCKFHPHGFCIWGLTNRLNFVCSCMKLRGDHKALDTSKTHQNIQNRHPASEPEELM